MRIEATQQNTTARVTGAIKQAAKATGTSFQYLLATAKVESNLNPSATAKTSSAGGLFNSSRNWSTASLRRPVGRLKRNLSR